jgi:hypothetical protein
VLEIVVVRQPGSTVITTKYYYDIAGWPPIYPLYTRVCIPTFRISLESITRFVPDNVKIVLSKRLVD